MDDLLKLYPEVGKNAQPHIKRVVAATRKLCGKLHLPAALEHDCVIAAYLHDLCKDEAAAAKMDHGMYAAIKARPLIEQYCLKHQTEVYEAISLHNMGEFALSVSNTNEVLAVLMSADANVGDASWLAGKMISNRLIKGMGFEEACKDAAKYISSSKYWETYHSKYPDYWDLLYDRPKFEADVRAMTNPDEVKRRFLSYKGNPSE
jgi:HD superfamily phosphohydrolase YqeK